MGALTNKLMLINHVQGAKKQRNNIIRDPYLPR